MKKIFFLILTIIISLGLSLIISTIIKANIFNIHEFGFQFLMFSIVGSVLYFFLKYLHIKNTVTILILLTLIFTFVYRATSIIEVVGNLQMLFIYLLMLFVSLAVIIKFVLLNVRFTFMKNLTFGISAALGYTLVHIIINIVIKTPISGSLFLNYFKNGFVIMLTLGAAFIVTEIVYSKIASSSTRSRIIDDNEDVEDDDD